MAKSGVYSMYHMRPKIKPIKNNTKTETYLTMGAMAQLVSVLVAGSITTPSFVITATSN